MKTYELGKISLSCSVFPLCGYGQSSIANTSEYKRKEIGGQRSQSTKGVFSYKSYLSGKDSLAGRLVLSLEWWVELTRHKFRGPCHKLYKELGPDSAPFHRKRRCTLHANTLQSA